MTTGSLQSLVAGVALRDCGRRDGGAAASGKKKDLFFGGGFMLYLCNNGQLLTGVTG